MTIVLVTGASGFVGGSVALKLGQGRPVRRALRQLSSGFFNDTDAVNGLLTANWDWSEALINVSAIIHCASRVHVMTESSKNPLTEYRQINVAGTLNLARQAAKAGVRRFIFISSIKVNGESTDLYHPFTADQIPMPRDPYGISKYEAEIGLMALSKESGMEIVIIRPPLVYGPGVKANFLSMMNWLYGGIPLPLGGVKNNRRSLVFIDNLISLIIACIDHPGAANQTFLVSDDDDLSTAVLLERMSFALNLPAKLIALPPELITLGAKLVGRSDVAQRLCGSLQVDIKRTKDMLDWAPPVSVDEGLRQTAAYFLKARS